MILLKENKDRTISEIQVDFEKLPCANCRHRYSLHCPVDCWNKDGKFGTY